MDLHQILFLSQTRQNSLYTLCSRLGSCEHAEQSGGIMNTSNLKVVIAGLGSLAVFGLLACSGATNNDGFSTETANVSSGIIGGTNVAANDPINKSTVALYDTESGALCTGSLIAKNIIISAAHCVSSNPQAMIVVFSTNISKVLSTRSSFAEMIKSPKVRQVVKAVISKIYSSSRPDDARDVGDISVIKFAGSAPSGYVPVQMLTDSSALKNKATVTLAGYGITNGVLHIGAGVLRQTQLQIADAQFSASEIELDQTKGHGACHGDSGGPAFINVGGKNLLWGITSRGEKDPKNDCTQYSVYTNALAYSKMIAQTIAFLNSKTTTELASAH